MAIVSISRIQHRRGKKLDGAGMPQLASGELGWAIDTQELYIGNGSVSEGAPNVGNTKILTQFDNILDFATEYSFRATDIPSGAIRTGTDLSTPVYRTIQERLDDRVTLAEFGATGDGSNQTANLQRALDQLYLNPKNRERVTDRMVLHIPAGEYLITSTINVPPFATIVGAGKEKTIFRSNLRTVFKTVSGNSVPPSGYDDPGSYVLATSTADQPRNIVMSDFTIISNGKNPAIILSSCTDSVFQDISIQGSWEPSDQGNWDLTVDNNSNQIAIRLDGRSIPVSSNNNRFINVDVYGFKYAVKSDDDVYHNIFSNNTFKNCRYGIVFGENHTGLGQGPSYNTIETCVFDRIDRQAIWVNFGNYNTSKTNKFLNTSNDAGSPATAVSSIIKFDTITNISESDFFERAMLLSPETGDAAYLNHPYLPDVDGRVAFSNLYRHSIEIGNLTSFSDLIKLPKISSGKIIIDYVYTTNNDIMREGRIEIICNDAIDSYTVNDEYNWVGDAEYSTLLRFDVKKVSGNVQVPFEPGGSIPVETLVLMARNTIPGLTNDTFLYTISIKA